MKDYAYTANVLTAEDELVKGFPSLLGRGDFERQLRRLEAQWSKASGIWVRRDLCNMLESAGIACKRDQPPEYYRTLIESSDLPDEYGLEKRMLDALMRTFRLYPSPEDYLDRIVARLSDPRDSGPDDTLRLKILKRFVLHTDSLRAAGYGGEMHIRTYAQQRSGARKRPDAKTACGLLDDGVFAVLSDETTTEAQRKPGGKYGLLKLADDLARGRFKTQGATRRDLYLFAMAYSMTFALDPASRNESTDIVKNLFRDYYANNVIRFAQPEYANAGDLESDPAGRDINYKNYAEMIYLYCIAGPGSPLDKVRRSAELLDKVRERAGEAPPAVPRAGAERHDTVFFRSLSESEGAFGMDADQFVEYLLRHYDVGITQTVESKDGPRKVSRGPMQTAEEQIRATDQFRRCVARLVDKLPERGMKLDDCRYGLWFAHPGILDALLSDGGEDAESLALILRRLNGLVAGRSIIQAIRDERVTRTTLLGVLYYMYSSEDEQGTDTHRHSFYEVYNDFKSEADQYLVAAGYQPISCRNLFDLLLVVSAYGTRCF